MLANTKGQCSPADEQSPRIKIDKKSMILKNEREVRDVYKISAKELGKGAFGCVYKCTHRELGFVRACKTISKSKITDKAKFEREIEILI